MPLPSSGMRAAAARIDAENLKRSVRHERRTGRIAHSAAEVVPAGGAALGFVRAASRNSFVHFSCATGLGFVRTRGNSFVQFSCEGVALASFVQISEQLARWHSRAYQTVERRAGGMLGLAWCNGSRTKSLGHSQMPPAVSRFGSLASGQALHRSAGRWHNLGGRQHRSDFAGQDRRSCACSGLTAGHNVGVAIASMIG